MSRKYRFETTAIVLAVATRMAFGAATNDAPVREVVITATRIEAPAREVASAITVIDRTTIEQQQNRTAVEILQQSVPGVDVNQSGGVGGYASVYIRGCKPEQVLVLIDGVDANDPSSAGRAFDWSTLSASNIERIEVLRGPQSTLYGSDAIGGVINIITRRATTGTHGAITAEYGSFDTFNSQAELNGRTGDVSYAVSVAQQYTEGISSAASKNGNTEKDGFQNTTLSGRFDWMPTDRHAIDLIVRYNKAWQQYDDFDYTSGLPIDGDNQGRYQNLFLRGQATASFFDNAWEQLLGLSLSDFSRDDTTAASISSFDGRTMGVNWQNNLHVIDDHTLTLGADFKEETAESTYETTTSVDQFGEKTADLFGIYAQDSIKIGEAFAGVAGARYDHHTASGDKVTARIAPQVSIKATGTRFKGSFGTGFKAPSLFQLYSTYGNENLKAEESWGWDAGIEQTLGSERATAEVTWFANHFDDMIDYDYSTYKYINISKAKTEGIESAVNLKPHDRLTIRLTYTYTETEDETTGLALLRRARNKGGATLAWNPVDKLNLSLNGNYVGRRRDQNFATASSTYLEDYILVNLAGSYDFTANLRLFARVNNVFDEDYEEVYGYGTMGVNAYGGVKLSF